jgi:hypothetical protein
MSHIALRRPLKQNWRVSEQGIRSYIKTKNWQGEAKVIVDIKLKTRENVTILLPDLTSQMRKIKPLKKLRYNPQGSEVFRCSSIGIDANRVNPERARLRLAAQMP